MIEIDKLRECLATTDLDAEVLVLKFQTYRNTVNHCLHYAPSCPSKSVQLIQFFGAVKRFAHVGRKHNPPVEGFFPVPSIAQAAPASDNIDTRKPPWWDDLASGQQT